MEWTAVVPVKRLDRAKSRLRGALPAERHPDLVLRMAESTVAAILACPSVSRVLVVTADASVRSALARAATSPADRFPGGLPGGFAGGDPDGFAGGDPGTAGGGARVAFVDDPGGGLNAALRHAAALAPPGVGVAALTADIPALRPSELDQALALCAVRSFVPDLPGTGTVLLAAPAGIPLDPRFGAGSAAAHAASGARRLDGDWPALRRDVDTAEDLAAAYALGWHPALSQSEGRRD